MAAPFLLNAWAVLLELAPWLLLGAGAAGLMHGLAPAGLIRQQLRGHRGVLKAVLIGIPMPLCSCGVIPAGISLRRNGASTGASLGFLIATPQTGVDSVLVSAAFLGWPFALFKVLAALVTGVLGGSLAERLVPEQPTPRAEASFETVDRSPKGMLLHGVDLVRLIWRWLLFGVVLSAALTTFLPDDALASLAGQGAVLSALIVLVAAVPLYVCATASVPVAAALVAGGLPTSTAMVFLMAGPAVSLASMGAVRTGLGGRALAVYLSTIIAGSLLAGLSYEALLGPLPGRVAGEAHLHAGPVELLAAVLLLGLFARFAVEDLGRLRAAYRARRAPALLTVRVTGMTCGGCAAKLERSLVALEGVQSASVQLGEGRARIVGELSFERAKAAIEAAGFGVGEPTSPV